MRLAIVFRPASVVLALLGALALAAPAGAAILDVCSSGCPYATIQAAVDAAIGGDTVSVYPGTYIGGVNFRGKAIVVQSTGGAATTFIDGGGSAGGVQFATGEGPSSVLDGFTIQNAMGTTGGLYCSFGSPTIQNCVIRGNYGNDGGVSLFNSNATLTNCVIHGNGGETTGGITILGASSTTPTLTNCTISGNKGGTAGGLQVNLNAVATVVNSIIWGNSASPLGYPEVFVQSGAQINISYSDVKGGWPGVGNFNLDPLFVYPYTISSVEIATLRGDYRLRTGSPCINPTGPDTGAYEYAVYPDGDGDLVLITDGDCNDSNGLTYPNAPEICDGQDNDCNGIVDDGYVDADRDGFFTCNDCDDTSRLVNPAAPEICDGRDNNCDGISDEGFDSDLDGYGYCVDCNDANSLINPGAAEVCTDKIDNNCNGLIDRKDAACKTVAENCTNGVDDDRDGLVDCADPDCARNKACR